MARNDYILSMLQRREWAKFGISTVCTFLNQKNISNIRTWHISATLFNKLYAFYELKTFTYNQIPPEILEYLNSQSEVFGVYHILKDTFLKSLCGILECVQFVHLVQSI